MTTTNQLTAGTIAARQIRQLRAESEQNGDLRQAMICVLALGGEGALAGAEPGTDAADLLDEQRSQLWAQHVCADVINSARAKDDSPAGELVVR